jgi:leucyl aminopeptidase
MRVSLIKRDTKVKGNLVLPFFEPKDLEKNSLFKTLGKTDQDYLKKIASQITWSEKESRIFSLPSNPKTKIILLGLGEKSKWQRKKLILAGRRIIAVLKSQKINSATLSSSDFNVPKIDATEIISLLAQNFLMADFEFLKFKEKPKEGWPQIKEIKIITDKPEKLKKSLQEGIFIGEEINNCRVLANTPGSLMTPKKLAEEAKKAAKNLRIKTKIIGPKEMAKLKMGGILGVSSGSDEKPRMIIMEYGPANKKPVVFVGKGLTFDSGGLNIKPSEHMLEMHMDMSGGAAVIHAIRLIARLKLPIRIIGIIPAAENMPSGSSYRQGDLLKTITGKTIEVLHTDAEGRIILADALGYSQKYKPSLIIDVATLTGAAVVALGQRMSAVFSNKDDLLRLGEKIGETTGDYAWPMPLWEEYDEDIKATFGDIANSSKTRYGGAITGAAFLKQFIGDYPWIHLDITPTMTSIDGQYLAKGATGAGVRFLLGIAKNFSGK